jgi:hypothetical protein
LTITEIAWEVHRHPPFGGIRKVAFYHASVTSTDYLTVKAQDGEWRWDFYSTEGGQPHGHGQRLDGGSRATLKAAKAAALAAWNARGTS